MYQALFQSFTESADPSHGAARAKALRAELQSRVDAVRENLKTCGKTICG